MTARQVILAHLAHGEPVAPADLADVAGITRRHACRMCDKLVLEGLLRDTPLGVVLSGADLPTGPRRTGPTIRARQDIVERLQEGPQTVPEVARWLKIHLRHARRLLAGMAAEGVIIREASAPTRVVWRLP